MTDIFHQPGFLGTSANFAADLTLVLMILIAGLLTVGFYLARRQRFAAHRWVQTSAVTLNVILVFWLMVLPYRDYVIRDSGGPRPGYFYWITSLHALLGAVAIPFGLFVTLRGNGLVPRALKFKNYKLFMRTAYTLYILTTLVGVLVYLTWFVWIPNPVSY